ncbi:MAG: MMPL family transporter [Gemmatimonadota bacterium]|nr:MAG: MMPL family transporter [Gemmatimonadota bacterium]
MSTQSREPGTTARYARWVIRRRWWVLVSALIVTVAAGTGVRNLGLSTDYRTYFSADNPDLLAYEHVENIYTRNDNVLYVIRPRTGDVFTERTLEAVRNLTDDSWQIPHSTRVDAITNFQHTWADGDNLIVEDLLGSGEISAADVERVREVSLSEPLIAGRLIASDGKATGINVRINLPGLSRDELPATAAHVRMLEQQYAERYPELEIKTTGVSMLNMSFAEAPMKDIPVVMPLMFGAFLITIVAVLRSFGGTAGTLAVILFATITAVGVAGHLGVFLDPTSASAPTIILTLAVADSVHILVSLMQMRRRGLPLNDALVDALSVNAQPVLLTSITTAIGFLSLNFSDSPPFRLLGNITAFGVMMAWVYSMTVLPALVAVLGSRVPSRRPGLTDRIVTALGELVVARFRPVLAVTGVAVVALSLSVSRLQVNDNYFEYFDESMPIRQGSDFALEHLTGVYVATFSLESGESQGVTDPEYLATVEAFTAWLEARPAVQHVNSFSHTMKRLNKNMHGDEPNAYRLPDERELGAQYLLLYELSLPYGLDVNDQINIDKSALRVDVTYGDIDTAELETEVAAAEAWLASNGTQSMRSSRASGPALMFAKITRRNIASMILGTGLGFAAIAVILMVALRSLRLGILSLIPNIVPAAMAFGVWAILVGQVGFAISVVAGLAIGIIVDDTVHFLSKYNRVRDRLDAKRAVQYAFESVGSAILSNTIIVAAGFAMLGLSAFRVTAYMGLLTSLTVVCALAVDFLLLPSLLIALDRRPATAPRADTHILTTTGATAVPAV